LAEAVDAQWPEGRLSTESTWFARAASRCCNWTKRR
jgi:hypothetical protein